MAENRASVATCETSGSSRGSGAEEFLWQRSPLTSPPSKAGLGASGFPFPNLLVDLFNAKGLIFPPPCLSLPCFQLSEENSQVSGAGLSRPAPLFRGLQHTSGCQ